MSTKQPRLPLADAPVDSELRRWLDTVIAGLAKGIGGAGDTYFVDAAAYYAVRELCWALVDQQGPARVHYGDLAEHLTDMAAVIDEAQIEAAAVAAYREIVEETEPAEEPAG